MLGHRVAERYPRTPPGWTVVDRHAVGPFTTRVRYRRPDGELVDWSSRFQRKHASRLSRIGRARGRWWAPRMASWWIGVLFAIGSTCFFLGPFPGFVNLVGSAADGAVFFVGSIFFTSAALLQYLEAANADLDAAGGRSKRFRVITFEPHRIDWWSTLIQFVGTLFFNVNTYRAMHGELRHVQCRPPRLGAGGGRLDLLPDFRPARLPGGSGWWDLAGRADARVEDRSRQLPRLHPVRDLRCGRLHRPGHRRHA